MAIGLPANCSGFRLTRNIARASHGRYQGRFLSLSLQSTVDGRATNAERLGNLGWPHALCLELLHLSGINRCRAALVNAGSLGLGDAFHLSLFAQVGLEL